MGSSKFLELNLNFVVTPSFSEEPGAEINLRYKDGGWVLYCEYGTMFDKHSVKKVIPSDQAEKLFSKLEAVRTHVVPDFAMSLDGTTYSLSIENGFNSYSYTWWGSLFEVPAELKNEVTLLLSWLPVELF